MPCTSESSDRLGDFAAFRTLIAPTVIKVLFWVGSAVAFCAGLTIMVRDDFAFGVLVALVGPILVRTTAELLMMLFKIFDVLCEIRCALVKKRDEGAGSNGSVSGQA